MCAELVYGEYDDWFLTSKEELNWMYQQRIVVGRFAAARYSSSSQHSSYRGWVHRFGHGDQLDGYKYNANRVRAIRAF